MFKKPFMLGSALLVSLSLVACKAQPVDTVKVTELDEEAQRALASFEAIGGKLTLEADAVTGGWTLNAPDGSARFFYSSDTKTSVPHDVFIELDSTPFVNAGLDTSKLPSGVYMDGKILIGQSLIDQSNTEAIKDNASDSLREILAKNGDILGYHESLDHFGITVSEGFVFEWAQDMATNDKDIVFVLDPSMFIEAGVAVDQIEGWIFATVEVMDADMKMVEVEKLLKPFDLS